MLRSHSPFGRILAAGMVAAFALVANGERGGIAAADDAATNDPAVDADTVSAAWRCADRFGPGCDAVAQAIDRRCPTSPESCSMIHTRLLESRAKAICDDGSLVECRAACDAGRPRTCGRLAKIERDGVRVRKDDAEASAILARACARGGAEECAERAGDLRESSPRESAALAARACASDGDGDATMEGCTLWMALLESRAYVPAQAELIDGLTRVCAREARGQAEPGRLVLAGSVAVMYDAAACGRLKDLPATR